MIGRMIVPAAQIMMMLLCRPKFKFLRFQMTVNNTVSATTRTQRGAYRLQPNGFKTEQIGPGAVEVVSQFR